MAICPEKMVISTERLAGANSVEGVIDDTAYLGDRSHFYVRINNIAKPVAVKGMLSDSVLRKL